ncbi:MAG: restriction endonuclease subunit S [Thermoleophilia bacterium]
MIAEFKPYPAMKDSGVPWLGDVPEHWVIERLKSSMSNVIQQTAERQSGDLYVALEHVESWTGLLRRADSDAALDSQVKRFRSGDVLFGKLRPYLAKVTRPRSDGVCVGEFLVLRPRVPHVAAPYVEQLLRSKPVIDAIDSSTFGAKMPRAEWQFVGGMAVALPPLPEQGAIVRFLDHADRRIRRYIRAKQKLIKLLEEQKQAIIHQAVTRGLNPNVRLKPSGVEWLGDVPEHWEVVALRRRWSVTDCKHLTVPFIEDEDGIPLASVREVQVFDLCLANAKRTSREHYASLIEGGRKPQQGDLLYCRNVSVGAAAVVTTDEQLAMGQDVCLIRSDGENQRYLNYFLRSPAMRHQLAMLLGGSTFNRINVADIKALTIVVPPRREQDAIAGFLDSELDETVRAQAMAKDEISLLREYRTRLIADVVTGKLDVREAAARLPDEIGELETLDEADAPVDPQEDTDEDLEATLEEVEA